MDERDGSIVKDAFANLEPATREQLEAAIEEGFEDFERGDHVSAREVLEQLRDGSSSAGMTKPKFG
jgi:predicted transcriptional regulator